MCSQLRCIGCDRLACFSNTQVCYDCWTELQRSYASSRSVPNRWDAQDFFKSRTRPATHQGERDK